MKSTVLVVEDEEKLRRVVELQLKTAGYEVEQAGTAEDALKLADRADVIITDLRLPGDQRPGDAAATPQPGPAHARHRHDRFRQHRNRGGSHESRARWIFCPSRFQSIT